MEGDSGRAEQLRRLFQAHHADSVRLAFWLTADWALAEELVQEAYLRLWRRWSGLRDQQAALAYLRATVVNLARSSLRRRVLERRYGAAATERSVETDPVARIDVGRALAALPAGKRACVVLRYLVGLSVEETAAVLGISTGGVKSQTHKGLRLLERALADHEGPVGGHAREVRGP